MTTRALVVAALAAAACPQPVDDGGDDPPIGAEGGPCTQGGACDPGLTCASNLCVRLPGEGEGECQGDEPAAHDASDCEGIDAAACDDGIAVASCQSGAAVLRSGLFEAAFDCLAGLSSSSCGNGPVDACFAALQACDHPDGDTLCGQATQACADAGETDFPRPQCEADLASVNAAFLTAWRDCFNASVEVACGQVHDECYNQAFASLVGS